MDIEGSEFAVFEDYFERNDTLPFTEILVRGLQTPSVLLRAPFAMLAASVFDDLRCNPAVAHG